MRIDSGLTGYYYDQAKYRSLDADKEEPAQGAAATPAGRTSAPKVESSTLLSFNLSGALWAMAEGGAAASSTPQAAPVISQPDTPERVAALYLEFGAE